MAAAATATATATIAAAASSEHGEAVFRKLVIQWDAPLLVLAWTVSFLGTFAASSVCCQASLCPKSSNAYHLWNLLAAVLFGLCSVWSLHFLAMLAASFPVRVQLDAGLTAFSAFVAVLFTYLALVSERFTSRYLRRRWRKMRAALRAWIKSSRRRRSSHEEDGDIAAGGVLGGQHHDDDTEAQNGQPASTRHVQEARKQLKEDLMAGAAGNNAGTASAGARIPEEALDTDEVDGSNHEGQHIAEVQPLLPNGASDRDERASHQSAEQNEVDGLVESIDGRAGGLNITNLKRTMMQDCRLRALAMDDAELRRATMAPPTGPSVRPTTLTPANGPLSGGLAVSERSGLPSSSPMLSNTYMNQSASNGGHGSRLEQLNQALASATTASSRRPSLSFFSRNWSSEQSRRSATPSSHDHTNESSDGGFDVFERRNSGTESVTTGTGNPSSTGSMVRGLPLTRRERSRLKAGSSITTSLSELLITLYGDCNIETILKAGIWAFAVCTMHYSGMWAFHLDGGFVVWNHWLVLASVAIAWVVCLVGILFMPAMEVNISRQLAFSIIASSGVFAMHMTGMLAAEFYSNAPNTESPGYPPALVFFITAFIIFTCLISTTMVSHAATLSRNKLVELIRVKTQLWKTLAQKEAVEATVALQTEFTSVAAHELRTPLYTISGYVDLLSRTAMDEEQALYVETVRRACHTIQLITTNVLDFTRLERANDETQARPVLVNIREFMAGLADITEDRGPKLDQPDEGLELIVDISDNVPEAIFLDETYLTRVLLNLSSNSRKFTTSGYIRIGVVRRGPDVELTVSDTGIGIPERFLERIFEPFRQADTTLTRVNNGSGLGLAICKRLVARLNGDLRVTSTEGRGSTFYCLLKDIQASGDYVANADATTSATTGPKKMMIFASSTRMQEAMTEGWRERGYEILKPDTSPQALLGADFIWADLPTLVKRESALLTLLKQAPADPSAKYPCIVLPYSLEGELLSIPQSRFVVPVKRPVVMHDIARILRLAATELPSTAAKEKPKLVRFASVASTSQSDTSEEPPGGRAAAAGTAEQTTEPEILPAKKKILLVEDNLVNAKLGQRMLTALGWEVLMAENGLIAFETVQKSHGEIFAVLMDHSMPIMNGEESTALIRKFELQEGIARRLVIIALSANTQAASSFIDAGADCFLSKPIGIKSLGEALSRYTSP